MTHPFHRRESLAASGISESSLHHRHLCMTLRFYTDAINAQTLTMFNEFFGVNDRDFLFSRGIVLAILLVLALRQRRLLRY